AEEAEQQENEHDDDDDPDDPRHKKRHSKPPTRSNDYVSRNTRRASPTNATSGRCAGRDTAGLPPAPDRPARRGDARRGGCDRSTHTERIPRARAWFPPVRPRRCATNARAANSGANGSSRGVALAPELDRDCERHTERNVKTADLTRGSES